MDKSHVLKDGLIISVPSLGEREIVNVDTFPELEAFTTSGGAAHTLRSMQKQGVQNCSYKTLRYKGHLDLMHYFLRVKNFNADQLAGLFRTQMVDSCVGNGDVVIVEVEAILDSLWGATDIKYRKTKIVRAKDGYCAMQRATAGGLVSAIFASSLDHGGPLTYADVDIEMFNNNMKILEIT